MITYKIGVFLLYLLPLQIIAMDIPNSVLEKNDTQHSCITSDCFFVQEGELPILLTAPHGGKLSIQNIQERKKGVNIRDAYTFELTLGISKALHDKIGKSPYIVAAHCNRKYIDFNRTKEEAYEDESMKPIYEKYHEYIAEFISKIKQQLSDEKKLLIDIHGQGSDFNTIFRGTQDKITVTSLLAQYGEDALTGPSSIMGILSAKGYTLFPSVLDNHTIEHASFNGGFTVGCYGSHNEDGIDAIQLEFGKSFRLPKNMNHTAQDMASAIATFLGYKIE